MLSSFRYFWESETNFLTCHNNGGFCMAPVKWACWQKTPGRTILTCDYGLKMKIYFQCTDSNFNTTDRKSIIIFASTAKILPAATNFFLLFYNCCLPCVCVFVFFFINTSMEIEIPIAKPVWCNTCLSLLVCTSASFCRYSTMFESSVYIPT